MRILQSNKSRAVTNKAAPPLEYCLHQRRQHPRSLICWAEFGRLCLHHIWMTKEWQKIRNCNTVEDSRPYHVPNQTMASIITWILSYKGTNKDSPVFLALHRNKIISITSEMISYLIKDGVVAIGKMKLDILCSEVGMHSIRSGTAMAMYLAGVPIFSIMLIGCWSSLAFLKYIRKQVREFSHGISSKMIEVQSIKHINNPNTTNTADSIVGNIFLLLMG